MWHKITLRWERGNSTPSFPSQAFRAPFPQQSHFPGLQLPEVNNSQFYSPKSFLLPQQLMVLYLNETLSSNPRHLAAREWQLRGCFAPGNYLFSPNYFHFVWLTDAGMLFVPHPEAIQGNDSLSSTKTMPWVPTDPAPLLFLEILLFPHSPWPLESP